MELEVEMPLESEEHARLTAEALVSGLEELKRVVAQQQVGGVADLDAQLSAGLAAVETMKQLLGGVVEQMRSLER